MVFDFLESISIFISSIIGMILNLISMLVTMLTAIPRAIAYVIGVVGYMPPFVGSIIIMSLGVAVTITLINHWGN